MTTTFVPPDNWEDDEPSRRSRGLLDADINRVCEAYSNGDFTLDEGKYLTPYIAGKVLKELDGLEKAPSTGAIDAVFRRWARQQYALFRKNPFAFIDFSPDAKRKGYHEFMADVKSVTKSSQGNSPDSP